MKTRTISAILMLSVFIPVLYVGGIWFDIAVFILALLSLKEFIDMKETKKRLPLFVKLISYLFMTLLIATNIMSENANLEIDFRILSAFFLTFLIPTVLYHDRSKYSINDAYYLIGGIFFLSLSFVLLSIVRNVRLALIIYFTSLILTGWFYEQSSIFLFIVGSSIIVLSLALFKTTSIIRVGFFWAIGYIIIALIGITIRNETNIMLLFPISLKYHSFIINIFYLIIPLDNLLYLFIENPENII